MAEQLGLEDRVHFLGYQDDVTPLLQSLDIFVQPSRSEALSLSMLEAMAAGTPVVAARTGGIPEVIEHGTNGLLFDPGDSHDLAAQLRRMLNPIDRRRFATRAVETQTRRFSAQQMIAATEALYRRLLAAA
jgi:glycosyltransferase involved in cell wall biosynthesis